MDILPRFIKDHIAFLSHDINVAIALNCSRDIINETRQSKKCRLVKWFEDSVMPGLIALAGASSSIADEDKKLFVCQNDMCLPLHVIIHVDFLFAYSSFDNTDDEEAEMTKKPR